MAETMKKLENEKKPLPTCAKVGIGILIGLAALFLVGFILCSIY